MKTIYVAVALLLTIAGAQACYAASDADAQVRINQIQVIGSHNSYHAGLLPGMRAYLGAKKPDASARTGLRTSAAG